MAIWLQYLCIPIFAIKLISIIVKQLRTSLWPPVTMVDLSIWDVGHVKNLINLGKIRKSCFIIKWVKFA